MARGVETVDPDIESKGIRHPCASATQLSHHPSGEGTYFSTSAFSPAEINLDTLLVVPVPQCESFWNTKAEIAAVVGIRENTGGGNLSSSITRYFKT